MSGPLKGPRDCIPGPKRRASSPFQGHSPRPGRASPFTPGGDSLAVMIRWPDREYNPTAASSRTPHGGGLPSRAPPPSRGRRIGGRVDSSASSPRSLAEATSSSPKANPIIRPDDRDGARAASVVGKPRCLRIFYSEFGIEHPIPTSGLYRERLRHTLRRLKTRGRTRNNQGLVTDPGRRHYEMNPSTFPASTARCAPETRGICPFIRAFSLPATTTRTRKAWQRAPD